MCLARRCHLSTSAVKPHLAAFAALTLALGSSRASAQPKAADDEDLEVAVPAQPAPAPTPAPAPSPAPAPPAPEPTLPPSAAPAPSPAPGAAVETPERSPASLAGLPPTTAPVSTTEAPRSLIAEGSNYVRPIRRGLTWWGFVQAQYEHNQISEDQLAPGGAPLNQDQFVLRRARLRFDRGWENAAATLEMDASTSNGLRVGPRRAEGSVFWRGADDDRVTPRLVLTAGITDLPFGAEIGESQRDRVFMERSIGSLALFPTEADVGAKLWGAYRFVNYAIAVVNGQPLNESAFPRDPNASKDVVGRVGMRTHIVESLTSEAGLSFYDGKGFSAGRDATKDSVTWVDDNNNGFAEPHELQGVPGAAAVASRNFERWALGLDLATALKTSVGISRVAGEVVVASNLDRGLLVSDPVLSGASVRQLVLSASFVQQITDYGFVGFRGAYYDPNSDVFEERAGVFHLRDTSFVVLSPAIGLTLPRGRVVAQYDFVGDHLGRDERGVPTSAKNDQLTLRLQVDL